MPPNGSRRKKLAPHPVAANPTAPLYRCQHLFVKRKICRAFLRSAPVITEISLFPWTTTAVVVTASVLLAVGFSPWAFCPGLFSNLQTHVQRGASTSEKTATVRIPISRHARMMRTAISPRLAMRILWNMAIGSFASEAIYTGFLNCLQKVLKLLRKDFSVPELVYGR